MLGIRNSLLQKTSSFLVPAPRLFSLFLSHISSNSGLTSGSSITTAMWLSLEAEPLLSALFYILHLPIHLPA